MTQKQQLVAVIGGSEPTAREAQLAEEVGRELARRGAALVCGGLGGVMEAACKGAGDEGGPLQTSWTPESGLAGDFFWSARAVDSFGSASEWAAPFRLQVLPVLSDDDRVDCICGTSNDEPGRGLGLLALALLGATVRRRSSGSRPV